MAASVVTSGPAQAARQRPLFGGYALVALVAAWLAGIALRQVGPLPLLTPLAWLLAAVLPTVLWLGAWLAGQRRAGGAGRWGRALLVAGMLGCWLALGAARAAAADTSFAADSVARLATGGTVRLRGVVAAEPDVREGYRLLTVDVSAASSDGGRTWQPATGRIEATVSGPNDWFAPAYGDSLALSGRLRPLGAGYAPPGVLAELSGARATVQARGGGNPLLAVLFALRLRLAQALQRMLPEPEAALLIGILLGLKTPALRARLPLFTATGTIHLVVPAGLKVSTLAELATYGVRRLGSVVRTAAALVAVGVYAALGGGGPAALRAAIMGALLALAPALGRAYNVFTSLALAVLVMTAVEPLLVFDAGFQLTALATCGLPLLVPPLQRRLARPLGWLPAGGAVAELLAVTLAAQIATLPVLALTFHQISLIAPVANLLTVPLLAPLLALGGLLALLAALGSAPATLAALGLVWLVWPLLWLVDAVISLCAALPLAAVPVPSTLWALAWLYYAALAGALAWLVPWLRRRQPAYAAGVAGRPAGAQAGGGHVRLGRRAIVALLLVALVGSVGAAGPALADHAAHLDFLDAGSGGEAILLRLPSGITALIDGGPDGPTLEALLAARLPFWQRSLDLAVLTDPRPGDVRGLQDVAAHYWIAHAADAGMRHPSADFLAWLDATRTAGAAHTQVRAGDTLALGAGSTLRVLAPPQQLYPTGEGDTTASDDLILRLDTPGLSALLLGSADDYALDALAYAGEPLRADVVEVALPAGAPLDLAGPLGTVLGEAHPRLLVICQAPVAAKSAARQAAGADLWSLDEAAATRLGATIYRTERDGTIALSGDASGWTLGG
jgi:competence protein ComEC